MEADSFDPSPAYTPTSTAHHSLDDDTSTTSNVTSVSASLGLTQEHIKAHLRLLRAFQALKWRVQGPDSYPEVASRIPPRARSLKADDRWVWFLQLAVERFTRWVVNMDITRFVHPPIDVWMVWHSYMLSPAWYAEDCERLRLLQPLKNLRGHPIDILVHTEGDLLDYRPSVMQEEEEWETSTQLPYDPFASCAVLQNHQFDCPNCGRRVVAPFLSDTGSTGYAQTEFFTNCDACNFRITRETLAVAKFARDLALDPNNSSDFPRFKCAVYLPGTLLDHSGRFYASGAKEAKDRLSRAEVFRNNHSKRDGTVLEFTARDSWEGDVKHRLKFSIVELRKNLDLCLLPSKVKKVMSAYTDEKPFSVDLVAAVLGQIPFTDKLYHLGWFNSEFFGTEEFERVSYRCIFRYQGFLSLISSLPTSSFFVPSLDIDFAWHTHLLSPANYLLHCRESVGKFLNHDDHTEDQNPANGFEYTGQAWQKRYSTPYAQCSCPDPSGRDGPIRRFSIRSRKKTSVHGKNCSVSAQPSVHPWVKVYGAGSPTSPVTGPGGGAEGQRRKAAYDRRNAALMVPGPLYLGY